MPALALFRARLAPDAKCRVHDVICTVLTHLEFIVMFRNRFDDAFPRLSPSFGPQELEYDITEEVPGSRAEGFLCATLGLLLNRKQDVKYATTPLLSIFEPPNWTNFANLFFPSCLDLDTITELWKMLLPRIETNGLRNGRARILSLETAPLPP